MLDSVLDFLKSVLTVAVSFFVADVVRETKRKKRRTKLATLVVAALCLGVVTAIRQSRLRNVASKSNLANHSIRPEPPLNLRIVGPDKATLSVPTNYHREGWVDVEVKNPDGKSGIMKGAFYYIAPPSARP